MNIPGQWLVVLALLAFRGAYGFDCEVEVPGNEGLPEELVPPAGFTWVGSPDLAARVPAGGHWTGMGPDGRYRDKWWWWREGYRANEEPRPELVIAASQLDAPAPPLLLVDQTTNAFGPDWDLMLIGMEFPSAGCWEVVAMHRGHELRFVFEVGTVEDDAGRVMVAEPGVPPVSPAPSDPDAGAEALGGGSLLDRDADFAGWLVNETRSVFDGGPQDLGRRLADAIAGDPEAAIDLHFLAARCPFVLHTRQPLQTWFERVQQDFRAHRFPETPDPSDEAWSRNIEEALGRASGIVLRVEQAFEYCSVIGRDGDVDGEALRWLQLAADLGHPGAQRYYHARAYALITHSLSSREPHLLDDFRVRADRYVRALIDAGYPQGYSLMSRMLLLGDVYEQDYLGAYAYAYAAKLLGRGAIVDEARIRMGNASSQLRAEEILEAERLANEIAGRADAVIDPAAGIR